MIKCIPILFLVSGAPGSGKTVLARKLAEQLCLPHINRDVLYWGLRFTLRDKNADVVSTGVPLFYSLIKSYLSNNISLVADATLYKGKSETDVKQLLALGTVVNIHCRTLKARERFIEREKSEVPDRILASIEDLTKRLDENAELFTEALDLGGELIEVDTTDGYDPSLQSLVKTLKER